MKPEEHGCKGFTPPESDKPKDALNDVTAGAPAGPPPGALDGLTPEARAAVIDLFADLTRRAAGQPEGPARAEDEDHDA